MDTPAVETVASSVALDEDVDIKKTEAVKAAIKEKGDESPSSATAEPSHTSPDLSFASEVL